MNTEYALLVLDMQFDFVDPHGSLYSPEIAAAIPEIVGQLAVARQRGLPVLWTVDAHIATDAEFAMFPPHGLVGIGREIAVPLWPYPNEPVIHKRRYSAFYGSDLDIHLRERRVTTLRVVGCCTDICVLFTVADARNRGYAVEVIRSGVATFSGPARSAAALDIMEQVLGATVGESDDP